MYLDTSIINENDINDITNNKSVGKSFCININHYGIEIHKDNQVNLNKITIYEWNNGGYQPKLNGECQIEHQLDNTNKILVTRLTSTDRNTDIFYFKGQEDGEFIKSVYCINNYPKLFKYVLEQSNTTCQNEFERLCNQQCYDEHECTSLININEVGEPQIAKNENGIEFINNILKQQVQKSDGFDYGLYSQLNYSWIILKCQQHINNIRLFPKLGKEYFSKPKKLYDFLPGFGLQLLQQNDPFKQNFAIIPVCTDGHISTLLLDLKNGDILQPTSERLYSFDSSLYHYDQNIFGDSISEDHKLSTQSLQLTGCCGYWASCFIEECSKITDIEEVKQQFKTGEMQLKVACRVSEIIDKGIRNNGLLQRIEQERHEGSDNYIEINIKDTNKYFLLDKENIYKSTCVDLEAIYNLIQQEDSQLEILGDGLAKLEEQIVKQNQKLFKIKQTRINEIKEQIKSINDVLEVELCIYKLNNLYYKLLATQNGPKFVEALKINTDVRDKLFCSNLAKLEYLKNKFYFNVNSQHRYLTTQIDFNNENDLEYLEECQLYDNNCNTNNYYDIICNRYSKRIQRLSPDLRNYFAKQQQYYNRLFTIEQRNIKNTQNDYSQIPNVNQLQLDELNRCSSEMGKSLDKNLKTTQLTKR